MLLTKENNYEYDYENALREIYDLLKGSNKTILAAVISWGEEPDLAVDQVVLFPGHSGEEHCEFLGKMDVCYDDGYGSQRLFGTLWFTDGTWASRWEYDGSEGWEIHEMPPLPTRK